MIVLCLVTCGSAYVNHGQDNNVAYATERQQSLLQVHSNSELWVGNISVVLYPVVISELIFHYVPIGSIRLGPGQSDGVCSAAQLMQHGNCGGDWGHGGEIDFD